MKIVIKIWLNWHIRLSQKAPIIGHLTDSKQEDQHHQATEQLQTKYHKLNKLETKYHYLVYQLQTNHVTVLS